MNRLIPLQPADIHVWLTFVDEIPVERLDAAYRTLLNAAEKAQEARFHFARDRRRYLVTRALVRTVLSRYVAVDPSEWIFSANAYGRPDVANAAAVDARLSFNVAHTHSLIVLGVTRKRALGVDVENIRAREVSLDIARRYFAPQEVAALTALPADRQQYRFFEYWTFKEAYIKARGIGLSLPLDRFSFHYRDDRSVEIAIEAELADDAGRWEFWQLRPSADHLVAICAERAGAQRANLIVRRTVPMQSEQECAFECLRASEWPVGAADGDRRRGAR